MSFTVIGGALASLIGGGGAAAGAGALGAGAAGAGAGALGAGAAGAGAAGLGGAAAGGLGAAGITGAGVTGAGLGSGAIGTGLTGAGLAAAPTIAAPAAGAAGGGAGLLSNLGLGNMGFNSVPQAMNTINTAQQAYNLVSHEGPVAKGDLLGTIQGGLGVYSGLQGVPGGGGKTPLVSAPMGATPSTHGPRIGNKEVLGRGNFESFSDLPPDIQKEILSLLTS